MRILLLLVLAVASANAKAPSVHWNETPSAFAGKIIRVDLSDGTNVEGYWVSVSPNDFSIKTIKSSKGHAAHTVQTLPRSSIRRIGMRKSRPLVKILGVVAGLYGTALPIASATSGSGEANIGAGLLGIGGGVAGYFISSHLSNQHTQRVLLIDP